MFDLPLETEQVFLQQERQEVHILMDRLKNWDPGLDPRELKLIRMQSITWNNGSLGCPIPGKYYTQTLVPGYLIHLKYFDQILEIHTDQSFRSIAMPGIGFI